MKQKISAILMIEVLGRPKEHLIETLEGMAKNIGEEKGIKVIKKSIKDPTEVKDKKDLFTSYAEIEVEVEEAFNLVLLAFKYMPAHIDVIEPEKLQFINNDFADLLTQITRRMHSYEEVVRVLQKEKQILENQLRKSKE